MASPLELQDRPRVLIVGGGYVGLYVAFGLQKKIAKAGGVVTLVDPMPYMTYQPFLPEVTGGNIEPRHAVVSFREHLPQTEVIQGKVVKVDHAHRVAVVEPSSGGEPFDIPYFDIVMGAGAITRTFPIPGLAEQGIGLKTIEEATALRNQIIDKLELGSIETDPVKRRRMLTFVVVGGGFAGVEAMGEMQDLAKSIAEKNPRLKPEEIRFVLVEAMGRIMPEVTEASAEWVVEHLRSRGVEVLLNTSLADATDGKLKLINMPDKSPADEFETDTLVWTAGVQASPSVRNTDFPIDDRGRIKAGADLRITGEFGPLENAWTAGDVAAVPDLSGGGVGGFCVPNAQHAVRQAKLLAKNLWASRWDKPLKDYKHNTIGAVAGLGLWKGVARVGSVSARGPLAWLMHRGYHGLAMPTFERKVRVIWNWILSFFLGRDIAPLLNFDQPRVAFVEAATPPAKAAEKPAPDAQPSAQSAANAAERQEQKPGEKAAAPSV
ncbi:FAD-dependent oxidoreductase [Acaricomes phytoseiuli]|uniref:NAD(P)/FAD-dependent oxidoreductase n=1 Tax=Acaricomes phytoseiuli TaxID=291968 RepID=UPI002223AB37|nr:FAD-dependent oxidoreductase [Acaricomes phytoseiuli]MCW1250435.1 FAD-dependent oxidoreductase [Acaricomes phytoseiuli]